VKPRTAGILVALILAKAASAWSTPSTAYWTSANTDVQPSGVWHIGVDNCFAVSRQSLSPSPSSLPTDVGITAGILPGDSLRMEIGVDALYPSEYPYGFNAKIGVLEGVLFDSAPGASLGVFNVGTKRGATDYNVLYLVLGKTLPRRLGRIHVGAYSGNADILVSSSGEKENTGWMIAYDRPILRDRISFVADYMSGENVLGGGGAGINLSLTPDLGILLGPVWFNDRGWNGDMKWSLQVDINL
jgi:hypothetical protein